MARQLSVRDIEARTAEMEAQYPDLYSTVNRMSMHRWELAPSHAEFQDFVRADSRRVRAVIHLLFGSMRHFKEVTGTDPYLSSVEGEDTQPLSTVPLYLLGAAVDPYEVNSGARADRHVILPAPLGDFAVEVTGVSMYPALHEGQLCFSRFTSEQKVGRLMVLHLKGKLILAYCIATEKGGIFATLEKDRKTFTLDPADSVFGWVTLHDPNVPGVNLGEPEEVAHSA